MNDRIQPEYGAGQGAYAPVWVARFNPNSEVVQAPGLSLRTKCLLSPPSPPFHGREGVDHVTSCQAQLQNRVGNEPESRSGRNKWRQVSRATPLVPSPVDRDGAARHPYPISEFGFNPNSERGVRARGAGLARCADFARVQRAPGRGHRSAMLPPASAFGFKSFPA